MNSCKNFYIFRISWVYSEFGSNFPKTILKLAREKREIKIVNDQYGSPTPTTLISSVIRKVLINDLKDVSNYGIYNLSPEEVCSWYDIGLEILKFSSKQEKSVLKRIIPVSSEEFSSVAKRPSYSYLDNTKLKKTFGIKIKNWSYYLNAYLKQAWKKILSKSVSVLLSEAIKINNNLRSDYNNLLDRKREQNISFNSNKGIND